MNEENLEIVKHNIDKTIKRLQKRFSEKNNNELCEFDEQIIATLKSLKIIYEQLALVEPVIDSMFFNHRFNIEALADVEIDYETSKSVQGVLYSLWIAQLIADRLGFDNELNLISCFNYIEKKQQEIELLAQ